MAVCVLAVCVLLVGAMTLFGINAIMNRLAPEEEVTQMGDLEREEVDVSSWDKVYTGEPEH